MTDEQTNTLIEALKSIEQSAKNLYVALRSSGPEYSFDDLVEMAADIAQDARVSIESAQPDTWTYDGGWTFPIENPTKE